MYSADYGIAQCIEAHTVTFINYKYTDSLHESIVMCAASRLLDSANGKVSFLLDLASSQLRCNA